MRAYFEVLSGGREGHRETLEPEYITVGRHPNSALRFDADADLQVSANHAAIFARDTLYVLRDLGSTNGTFVNGTRLTSDHVLADEDILQFGPDGPRVRFRMIREDQDRARAGSGPRLVQTTPPRPRPAVVAAQPAARIRNRRSPGASTRIRAEVARQTATFRRWAYGVGGIAAAGWGALLWQGIRADARMDAQRRQLIGQVDSLTREFGSLTINVQSLRASLDSAQRETARLRDLVSRDDQSVAEIQVLRRDLQDALAHQRHIALAASLDPAAITGANQDAVGIVLAEFADGTRTSATGFGVRSDRGGGFVVTNKHAVLSAQGRRPARLGVVFDGTNQNFEARVVSTHDEADVALLRVGVSGGIPTVEQFNWREPPVVVGDAVGIVGYPFGLDLPMGGDWRRVGITATFVAGSVTRVLPTLIQFDGFGTQGSSGSPVFDRDGKVVGIIFGGERGQEGRIVYAVPAAYALELLDKLP